MCCINYMKYEKTVTYSLNFPPCKINGCSAMLSFTLQEQKLLSMNQVVKAIQYSISAHFKNIFMH
jgi:hypothetical protein